MKIIIIIITMQIIFMNICMSLPEDPVEYAAWERRALEAIKRLSASPLEEAIPGLSLRLRQISRPGTPNYEQGDRPVFRATQAALLSIPGHAEYYEQKIKQARLKYEEAVRNGDIGATRNDLYNEQMYGFATLGQLPSVETVRVLGEFLFDDRGKPVLPPNPTWAEIERAGLETPNSLGAARALNSLPLVSRPFPKKDFASVNYDDIDPWRLWYEQVKAGTRTFRFEGDPQEYNLDGPVRHAKDGPSTQRPSKRDEPFMDAAARKKNDQGSVRVVLAVLAGLLAVFAWWRYLTLRGKATT